MSDKKIKSKGQIYTPDYIVGIILNMSGYKGNAILKKHVIDNSCGDGAFLTEIVTRYYNESKKIGLDDDQIVKDLGKYIHGIEIDTVEHSKCVDNLNKLIRDFGLTDINWDIICADSLTVTKYNNKMDFVLGNPPYVRVHNLGDSFDETKSFLFSSRGMTDLYITFFEIGIRMLNDNGVLGYITPSSYFTSTAGSVMRRYIVDNNLFDSVVDLKHFQPFTATTYTAITILKKVRQNESIIYYTFDGENRTPVYCDTLVSNDFYINDCFYFDVKNNLKKFKKIFNNIGRSSIEVKNGFATLCDSVFIKNFDFKSKYIIPVIKGSTGEKTKIIYPYDKKNHLVSENDLKLDSSLYSYLLENKNKLRNRSLEEDEDVYWYAFGRSQAIGDTYKNKLSINSLLRDKSDWKFNIARSGTGVYSGLYIVSPDISFDDIQTVLSDDEFIAYIKMLGKYKSGGYYTFSTKDVKKYLDYKFNYQGGLLNDDQ